LDKDVRKDMTKTLKQLLLIGQSHLVVLQSPTSFFDSHDGPMAEAATAMLSDGDQFVSSGKKPVNCVLFMNE